MSLSGPVSVAKPEFRTSHFHSALSLCHTMSFTSPAITLAKCKPHKGLLLQFVVICLKFPVDDVLCKHSGRVPFLAINLGAWWLW